MNHAYAQDRKRWRVASTTHDDQETFGLDRSDRVVLRGGAGRRPMAGEAAIDPEAELSLDQEHAGAQLDGEVDAAHDAREQHADEPAPERSPGAMDNAWHRLLRFLANGDAQEAAVYEHARSRLLQFFAARGKMADEELADATFDRVAAKLSDEVVAQVRCPVSYMLRFAHFIYLEHIKREIVRHHRLAALPPDQAGTMENAREDWLRNERLALVERCLDELAPAERALLRGYYMHDGRSRIASRQEMSRELGITPALLRTRVSRLQRALGQRVRALAEEAALA